MGSLTYLNLGRLHWHFLAARPIFWAVAGLWLTASCVCLVLKLPIGDDGLSVLLLIVTPAVVYAGAWRGAAEDSLYRWAAHTVATPREMLVVAFAARAIPAVLLPVIYGIVTAAGLRFVAPGLIRPDQMEGSPLLPPLALVAVILQFGALCMLFSMLLPGAYNSFAVIALGWFLMAASLAHPALLPGTGIDLNRVLLAAVLPYMWFTGEHLTWAGLICSLATTSSLFILTSLLLDRTPVKRRADVGPSLLSITEIHKFFGGRLRKRVHALRGLSLSVPRGRVVGLLGRNGAGKTTTLRVLLGQLGYSSGDISWDDKRQTVIRFLPEDDVLARGCTARHYLPFFCGTSQNRRVLELSRCLHVEDILDTVAGKLSAGQRRRLAMFVTLASPADLYVLDEPAQAVDPIELEAVKAVLLSAGREGATILLSTHLLREFDDVVQDSILVEGGRVAASGETAALRSGLDVWEIEGSTGLDSLGAEIGVLCGRRLIVKVGQAEKVSRTLEDRGLRGQRVTPTLHDVFLWEVASGHAP